MDRGAKSVAKTLEGGRFYIDDPRLKAQRIVIRVWPSSHDPDKWVIEAFAPHDCPVEVVVLPASSPWGSPELDMLTRASLTPRGMRVIDNGRQIYSGVATYKTPRQMLAEQWNTNLTLELLHTLERVGKEIEQQQQEERIKRWQALIG